MNSPENSDAANAPDAAEAAPRKRRRRVVRDVVTPGADAPVATQDAETVPTEPTGGGDSVAPEVAPQVQVPDVEAPEEPEPVQAPAPTRARRSRRVTRTVVLDDVAAAPVQQTPVQDAPVDVETPDDEVTAPAEVEEPATDDDASVDVAPADEPEASGVADALAEDAAERAPRRRRSGRRGGRTGRSAQDADDEQPTAADVPADEAVVASDKERSDAPLDVLAELGPVRTEEPVSRTRLATTALLFQAPDPEPRTRRRRAQASAGSPQEISDAARTDVDEAARSGAEESGADAAVEAAAESAPAEGAGRARRRRGGRGRKAQVEDEATEPENQDESQDEPQPDVVETDVTDGDDDGADDDGDDDGTSPRRRRRRGGRGRRGRADAPGGDDTADEPAAQDEPDTEAEAPASEDAGEDDSTGSSRRRRRRRRGARGEVADEPRRRSSGDEVTALRGSTRLEAKRQRRREGRDAGRRRQVITEAEFLARREAVERAMVVREVDARTQIAVLEDGVLVEHYVSNQAQASMVGNVYLGRVQNVLPSMEAAFVDVGKGRNAVLYAGEVNWDAAGLDGGQPRRIEQALKSGDAVLVQVTKDPIGHKGARLTSQITLAGRYLVYVPGGGMTGISRKLPDIERSRLKKILRDLVPDSAGVIVRTAAEGATEEELRADVARLQGQWEAIEKKRKTANAPALLQGEPDMAIRVVRDIFNDDFSSLVVQGDDAWSTISTYVGELAPDLAARIEKWTGTQDVFTVHRVDEQLAKGMDRKVWLPSGGSLVIDRTEAMTVVDVNTGKFTGAGGTLEETVTRNNLEAAEEIVRQLRLRDIGGIIVIDFIDMVLESNRDLVLRRLVECLGRDRTKHQVAEVTSLGLVQMTRKRVGQGLVEAFSETCEHCHGRGFIVHTDPVGKGGRPETHAQPAAEPGESKRARRKRGSAEPAGVQHATVPVLPEAREAVKATLATIAAAAAHAHEQGVGPDDLGTDPGAGEGPAGDASVGLATAPDETPVAGTRRLGTLDVMAELGTAGVQPAATAGPATAAADAGAVETDAPLELHTVAPEVFEDTDGEPEADGGHDADGTPQAASDAATDGAPAPADG